MKQVVRERGVRRSDGGAVLYSDLPAPLCFPGGVLVRTAFSLLSVGTERAAITSASLVDQARSRPELIGQLISTVKSEGVISAVEKVRAKLAAPSPLGYSASGIVLESQTPRFLPGDRVACAGAGHANHAEVIAVPENLTVKVPPAVPLEEAAYLTVASIALQGVRQADVRIGENCVVVGLGLIGQLTAQLLRAAGCRVFGFDTNVSVVERSSKFRTFDDVTASQEVPLRSVEHHTHGMGCDAVLITASTESNAPLELSLRLSRKRGTVVVVGDVGLSIPRALFYPKEIDLRIACSYGPGRYDPAYEERGQDYPYAYVRWTENRNMQAVIDLLAAKSLDVAELTTHRLPIERVEEAYSLITRESAPNEVTPIGVVLEYDSGADVTTRAVERVPRVARAAKSGALFIGPGSFAASQILPVLREAKVPLVGVAARSPITAKSAAERFDIPVFSTDALALLERDDIGVVFCCTRHDSHARYVRESLVHGKAVFVEKPLAVTTEQLNRIDEAVRLHGARLLVGFNRRFSLAFQRIREHFNGRSAPMMILYRVSASSLPADSWIYAPEQGGRIIGECCHFIDAIASLTGALPSAVIAKSLGGPSDGDNVSITVSCADGSVGTIVYSASGSSAVPKERLEVFCDGKTAILDNFETLSLSSGNRAKRIKLDGRKGHREELEAFLSAVQSNEPMPIPYDELRAVTAATFAVHESMQNGREERL